MARANALPGDPTGRAVAQLLTQLRARRGAVKAHRQGNVASLGGLRNRIVDLERLVLVQAALLGQIIDPVDGDLVDDGA
jgi:hypothetical protein